MQNNINLEVTNIIGKPIGNMSRITVSDTLFNLIKQSCFARLNKEKASLMFTTRKDEADQYIKVFNLNGVELLCYTAKAEIEGQFKNKTYFFTDTEIARDHLIEIPKLSFNVSSFSLA